MQETAVLPRAPKNVTERFSLSCCKLGEADRHNIYYGEHSCSKLEAVVRTPKLLVLVFLNTEAAATG
jgi:hypothetical protein